MISSIQLSKFHKKSILYIIDTDASSHDNIVSFIRQISNK